MGEARRRKLLGEPSAQGPYKPAKRIRPTRPFWRRRDPFLEWGDNIPPFGCLWGCSWCEGEDSRWPDTFSGGCSECVGDERDPSNMNTWTGPERRAT